MNNKLENENQQLKKEIEKLKNEKLEMRKYYENLLDQIDFKRFLKNNHSYIKKNGVLKYIKNFFLMFLKIILSIARKIKKKILFFKHIFTLKKILKNNNDKDIYVFYPGYDWYMKMYQRPQHMAINIANKNNLYFYCTMNLNDKINGFKNIEGNVYVSDQWELLKKKLPRYNFILYANINGCWLEELKKIESSGNNILYEYIDDLHDDLTDISPKLVERHEYVLKNENIPILCTAKYLYNKVKKVRKNNIYLSTNGVNYEDFHITKKCPLPEKIADIVNKNRKIVGYYGALAKWFDYELVIKIAKEKKEWDIVLIGVDYDNTLGKYNYFNDYKNIHYLGIVPYKELVNYGYYCDVLTIPFLVNDITLATSPVKVFEYMAMERPIVTTALPECKNYKSVMIANNHDQFIKLLEKAMTKTNDKEYKKILRHEALSNTWDKKASEIVDIFNKCNSKK